jgi:hypothetical protein
VARAGSVGVSPKTILLLYYCSAESRDACCFKRAMQKTADFGYLQIIGTKSDEQGQEPGGGSATRIGCSSSRKDSGLTPTVVVALAPFKSPIDRGMC